MLINMGVVIVWGRRKEESNVWKIVPEWRVRHVKFLKSTRIKFFRWLEGL